MAVSSDNVYIVGVSMTPFGKALDKSLASLAENAANEVVKDAGISYDKIQAVFFANAVQGAMERQYGIRGQAALQNLPLDRIPIYNVENACASASTALNLAITQVQAGSADVVMAIGAEKMVSKEPKHSIEAFLGSLDFHNIEETKERLNKMGSSMPTPTSEKDRESARTFFMDVYAAFAKYHMARFGTTQRQMALVSAKNHNHSVYNPLSQHKKQFSVDEILDERLITWPFTLPMCSPISDGAAAAIVCNEKVLNRTQLHNSVKVRSSVIMHGGRTDPDDIERHISHIAAQKAYDISSVSPVDISVAEVHDATAFGEIQQSENLGFCSFGEGGLLAERGETTLGGRIPINPSGGLESKGHPIGATGLGQIYELVNQLRNTAGRRQVEGARLGLAENGGGLMGIEEAAVSIVILEGFNKANKYI